MTITPDRADYLTGKYGLAWPPVNPALNTTVAAILANERIEDRAEDAALFDPNWSPAMWECANAAMRDLRDGLADGSIRLDAHDYDLDHCIDLENPPTDAVFVWRVGSKTAMVGCRAGASHDERRLRGPAYFTNTLALYRQLDDYHRFGGEAEPRYEADYELQCTVKLAGGCTAPLSRDVNEYGGGTTRLLTLHRGQFLLLFRVCRVCETLAGQLAETNFKIGALEAQATLPPSARINPGSPVPPTM